MLGGGILAGNEVSFAEELPKELQHVRLDRAEIKVPMAHQVWLLLSRPGGKVHMA